MSIRASTSRLLEYIFSMVLERLSGEAVAMTEVFGRRFVRGGEIEIS